MSHMKTLAAGFNVMFVFIFLGSCAGVTHITPALWALGILLNCIALGLSLSDQTERLYVSRQRNIEGNFRRIAEELEWANAIENASWYEEFCDIDYTVRLQQLVKEDYTVGVIEGIEAVAGLIPSLPMPHYRVCEAASHLNSLKKQLKHNLLNLDIEQYNKALKGIGLARVNYENTRAIFA